MRAICILRAQRAFFAAARPLKLIVSCLGETLSLSSYESVAEELERHRPNPTSAEFCTALGRLRLLAENGDFDAAGHLAEILSSVEAHRDIESAYKWYYIALSAQGFSTSFRDLNDSPPYYGGPAGDFRNEAQVSALVTALGFALVRRLDDEAQQWLNRHAANQRLQRP